MLPLAWCGAVIRTILIVMQQSKISRHGQLAVHQQKLAIQEEQHLKNDNENDESGAGSEKIQSDEMKEHQLHSRRTQTIRYLENTERARRREHFFTMAFQQLRLDRMLRDLLIVAMLVTLMYGFAFHLRMACNAYGDPYQLLHLPHSPSLTQREIRKAFWVALPQRIRRRYD